jgi:hypothetical protein
MDLPDVRTDGKCAGCTVRVAVTRDGRFCLRCLRSILPSTPPCWHHDNARRPAEDDPDPDDGGAFDNAVRALEDG